MRILLVEDDALIASFVEKGLRESGHVVDRVGDGTEGLHRAQTEHYDALVLDRMLPGLDGLEVLRRLRAGGDATPALVLSSLGDVEHRVEGLREGADDYLAKPFSFVELLARLEGLQRRARPGAPGPATPSPWPPTSGTACWWRSWSRPCPCPTPSSWWSTRPTPRPWPA